MNREKQIDECFCRECGNVKKKSDCFCPHCDSLSTVAKKKDKGFAIFLAIFAGNCGGHHFYLGQSARAILSILTLFLSIILSAIYALPLYIIPIVINTLEIIYLIAIRHSTFHEKYNR